MRRGNVERLLLAQGLSLAGVDEVGRGCLAGPVYAGCVVLDYVALRGLPRRQRDLIRDSKELTPEEREEAAEIIREIAVEAHVAKACPREIERLNILQASFLAMRRALANLSSSVDVVLVDGNRPISGYDGRQRCLVKGDSRCYAIAAASILAKVERDNYMKEAARQYPGYGFETNVGYGTPQHLEKIRELGICELHRRTFAPVTAAPTSLFGDLENLV